MSSKFSQVRNLRQKPPHCNPGIFLPPPPPPHRPDHLYCWIEHEFEAWGNIQNFHFHLWEYPPLDPANPEWKRLNPYDAIENITYTATIETTNQFQTFDLSLNIIGSFGGPYVDYAWSSQTPIRQFPLKTQLLHCNQLMSGCRSDVLLQVIDTGKAYPPPIPGNYGPY